MKKKLEWEESLSLIYIITPLLIFFAFFIRTEIAIPACAYISWQLLKIVRETSWPAFNYFGREHFFYFIIAIVWVFLSGGIGGIYQNQDWIKHYAIINFLSDKSWPATGELKGLEESVIRYAIGWYLIPSSIIKLIGEDWKNIIIMIWSMTGIFLFFNLLPKISKNGKISLAIPVVFVLFGGADIAGHYLRDIQIRSDYHLEWWASFAQYSSNTTSIFWVPQHAIPSWIGIAYLIRSKSKDNLFDFIFPLFAAIILWSPFSALGIAPFILPLIIKKGLKETALRWHVLLPNTLIGLVLLKYMTSNLDRIPTGFSIPSLCTTNEEDCLSFGIYFAFVVLEFFIYTLIVFSQKKEDKDFLLISTIILITLPMFKMGVYNDIVMRSSLPAIAILAIFTGKTLILGSKIAKFLIVFLISLALPTTITEVYRGILLADDKYNNSKFENFSEGWNEQYLHQYFSTSHIGVIKYSK